MTAHKWCRCTETPCGTGLLGHEGHCCLRADSDCTETPDGTLTAGALGWMAAHAEHCPVDHTARISQLVELTRKETPCAPTN